MPVDLARQSGGNARAAFRFYLFPALSAPLRLCQLLPVPFRFLHTADLHLDSPLKTLALRDAALGTMIANATRQAFVRIVDACLEEAVDALLVAGDLYDGEIRSMATPLFLGQQFKRLDDAGIAVFLVRGNHDAAASVTRHLSLPGNVTVFATRGECRILEAKGVAIHGISFPTGQVAASLLPKFGAPVEGLTNIGILHTSLAGAEGHDVYAPCSVGDLTRQGYDYWALGHIHKRQIHNAAPAIVMPGMPQGRDINEAGRKSATLVTIATDRSVTLSELPTAVAQFERITIDVTGCENTSGIADRMRIAMAGALSTVQADSLVARLILTGTSPLASRLRRDPDLVLAEAQQAALQVGRTLIDTVEIRATLLETKSAAADPVSDIRQILLRAADTAPELVESATALIAELRAALPPELRKSFGDGEADMVRLARQLIAEGSEDVLARLSGGEDL